jgi:cell division protein FtsQ
MMMPRKRSNKRKPRQPVKSGFALPQIDWGQLGSVALLALVGVGFWMGATWVLERPVNSVRVDGRFERVSALQVEAAMAPYLDEGFLKTDLQDMQQAIVALPWVQEASVRRSWPSTFSVSIIEERAAARWGEDGLLNVYGELFVQHAKHVPAELPRLSGPANTEFQVAQQFFELDTQLEQRGLYAVTLKMDERGSWELGLSNGIVVRFGAVEVATRAARFFRALDGVLQPLASKVEYVDMRYTNGFAVGWKSADRMELADKGETDPHA